MFEKKLKYITLGCVNYPYKCTIGVIERLQERFGNLQDFEIALKYKGQDRDCKNPQIEIGTEELAYLFTEMIAEGIEIENLEIEPITEKDFKTYACDEYGLYELFLLATTEFTRCFATKKNVKTTQGKKIQK